MCSIHNIGPVLKLFGLEKLRPGPQDSTSAVKCFIFQVESTVDLHKRLPFDLPRGVEQTGRVDFVLASHLEFLCRPHSGIEGGA